MSTLARAIRHALSIQYRPIGELQRNPKTLGCIAHNRLSNWRAALRSSASIILFWSTAMARWSQATADWPPPSR